VSGERTAELRRAFDDAFALPPPVAGEAAVEPVLMLTVGGDPYAVRVTEVAGFEKARPLLVLPGATPHLLGLAGLRGRLMPVFSLATVMGYRREDAEPWLLIVGRTEPLALAFTGFEGLARLASETVGDGSRSRTDVPLRGHVRVGAGLRGLLDLTAVRDRIQEQAGMMEPAREH
jgi:purine-binding chemotaxis protein CheW